MVWPMVGQGRAGLEGSTAMGRAGGQKAGLKWGAGSWGRAGGRPQVRLAAARQS